MKKILHISNYYYPHIGGIEQVAQDIIENLTDQYEHYLICFNDKKETVHEQINGLDITRVGILTKVFSQAISLGYRKELKKIIENFKPDYIHIHLPNPLVTVYLLSLNLKGIKIITHWHSDIIKQKLLRIVYKPLQNKILKLSSVIIATSPDYLEGSVDLKEYKDKTVIIPNIVNEDKLSINQNNVDNSLKIREKYANKKLCLFLGRHVEYKGLEYLIKSANYLNNNVHILIAGEGKLTPKLKIMANNKTNIEFIGRLSNDKVKEYLLATDIFAFPSITKNEAFGIALAEALYYGKPAVSFNIEGSGVNYVNLNEYTGYVVENKNVVKLAEAINKLCMNEEIYHTFSQNAKIRTKELFTKDKFVESLSQIYPNEN